MKNIKKRQPEEKAMAIKLPGPLTESVIPFDSRGRRDWRAMNDEEVVRHTHAFLKENGMCRRKDIEKADSGLYDALTRRGLLASVGFDDKCRRWADKSDDAIVDFARKLVDEKKLRSKSELKKEDNGLYIALLRRKLICKVGFKEGRRSWTSMNDQGMIGFARGVIVESGIKSKQELRNADNRLFQALKGRKLLEKIGFPKPSKHLRDWESMMVEEIAFYAQEYIKENDVHRKTDLYKADSGLYSALRTRKLLDSVFSSIESDKQSNALTDIIDSVREFGGSE